MRKRLAVPDLLFSGRECGVDCQCEPSQASGNVSLPGRWHRCSNSLQILLVSVATLAGALNAVLLAHVRPAVALISGFQVVACCTMMLWPHQLHHQLHHDQSGSQLWHVS